VLLGHFNWCTEFIYRNTLQFIYHASAGRHFGRFQFGPTLSNLAVKFPLIYDLMHNVMIFSRMLLAVGFFFAQISISSVIFCCLFVLSKALNSCVTNLLLEKHLFFLTSFYFMYKTVVNLKI
jgi:hypothetical protein